MQGLAGSVVIALSFFSTSMLGVGVTADDFIAALTDSELKWRRAKYILFKLQKGAEGFTLAVHLRMTGNLFTVVKDP